MSEGNAVRRLTRLERPCDTATMDTRNSVRRFAKYLIRDGRLAGAACAAALILSATTAQAQGDPKSLGTFDAWTAVEMPARAGKICYMVARPAKSLPEGAKRGDILLTVTHRPAAKQRDEVSFQSGYPYKAEAPVVLEVEKKKPESAWSRDTNMDKALVAAMRAGNSLTIKGSSARGTDTTDTFSLDGFSKAYAEIGKACGIK
jgi:hypothetical protein